MTGKEIKQARNTLPARTRVPWAEWTEEQKQLDRELFCREMINSLLIYHGHDGIKQDNYFGNKYLSEYRDELGDETVDRLCAEQLKDFEKAVVHKNVGTDGEGLSYNSIVWADDVPFEERLANAIDRSEHINDAADVVKVNILQVKEGDEGRFYRFSPLRYLENGVDDVKISNYDNVYSYSTAETISLEDTQRVNAFLDGVYTKFNTERPADFKGRSLSVSDVVVISKGSDMKAYYCDSFEFQELSVGFVDEFKEAFLADKAEKAPEIDI